MADKKHLVRLNHGVKVWNTWRRQNPAIEPDLSDAVLDAKDLRYVDFSNADLTDIDLSYSNLSGANLSNADLFCANLRSTKLSNADLSHACLDAVQALGTDFESALLTGACIQDWNINTQTNLQNVRCDYIYLKFDLEGQKYGDRRPHNLSEFFVTGDFAKLVQKSLHTVDLIFRKGLDWRAFAYSFQHIQVQYKDQQIAIYSIENQGDGTVIVRLAVAPDVQKNEIEESFWRGFKVAQRTVLEQYEARIADKDSHINQLFTLLQKSQEELGEAYKLMAEQPKVQQNFSGIVHGVAGNVEGDQNINVVEQKQTLAEAALEIQQLLYQLSQTGSMSSEAVCKAVHQEIQRNPTLRARLLNALKAGGLEALKSIFDHPLFSIPAETVKGWLEAE